MLFQYIVIPTRRSTAEAVQILMSHLLGDAGSPFLVGIVRSLSFFMQLSCSSSISSSSSSSFVVVVAVYDLLGLCSALVKFVDVFSCFCALVDI